MPHWSWIDSLTFTPSSAAPRCARTGEANSQVGLGIDHALAAGGGGVRRRGGRPTGKTRQRVKAEEPMVTLFYDSIKKLTVAVLAQRVDAALTRYLEGRLGAGSAYRVSPLYVELEGYVRENRSQIQQHLDEALHSGESVDSTAAVSVAIGSLEQSDDAHRHEMEAEWQVQRELQPMPDETIVEQVLELARLHRLDEDLDVLSIYSMRRTSKAFARVAQRMSHSRLATTTLVVTPLVDGVSLSGYSRVLRRDGALPWDAMSFARHTECEREIEYEQLDAIRLRGARISEDETSFIPQPGSTAEFSWKCEEIAPANFHRWWGDITLPDYEGQKLMLTWIVEPGSVDDLEHFSTNRELPITSLRIPAETRLAPGSRLFNQPCASFQIRVHENSRLQRDDVTMLYTGRMEVVRVHVDFLALVRASARATAPMLREKYDRIKEVRPLMRHEEQYLEQVESLARPARPK